MLTKAERNVLNIGLQKYRPGQFGTHFSWRREPAQIGVAADEPAPVALEEIKGAGVNEFWKRISQSDSLDLTQCDFVLCPVI
jgi:hypothetical protein